MTAVEDAHDAPPVPGGAEPAAGEPRRPPRGTVWLGLGAVLAVAAGAGIWSWASGSATEPVATGTGPVATAVVERGTISATDSWDGTLDYGQPATVAAGGGGVITRLAGQGRAMERGKELYRLNEQPVILLSGAVPMYRDLEPGDSGADVEQLEANLEALGYGGFTDQAVRAWQSDLGAAETGRVSSADVVFLPEGGRVDSVHVKVGERVSPGAPVLDITGAEQVASLVADLGDRDRFDIDTEVTIVLPGGEEVPGTVSAARVVDVQPGSSEDPGSGQTGSVVQVEVALAEQAGGDLVGTPVEVVVAVDERNDVLLVPVNALLALAEGGYGLEVIADDGTTSIVAVTTGLFADGTVQVAGDGIAEGVVVGVAGR